MESLFHLDPFSLIQSFGYLGLVAIVFAESGLLIGFFLPGDSLLFTAGILASQGYLDIIALLPLLFIAAVLGDNFGYAFGRKVGPAIFRREDSRFFHKKHLEHAKVFYEKYGPKTLVLARFMPVVRTFVPIIAGVGNMSYPTFLLYNLIGGLLWSVGITLLGYFLGQVVPDIERYIIPVLIVIIATSVLPGALELLKERKRRRSQAQ